MKETDERNKAYQKAKEKVENEKGFYIHLVVYIIMNIAILFFKGRILEFVDADPNDKDLNTWWGWSNLLTPLLWGIGLLFHYLWAFNKTFMFNKEWEKRKIKEFMEDEDF